MPSLDDRTETGLTVVHLTSSGNRSGGTRQAVLLCRGLREAGHRVVLCGAPNSPVLEWAEQAGVPTRPLRFGGVWGQWRASRELRSLVEAEGADVVHAHHTKAHNVALLATFGGKFPPVVANRGVLFRPKFPAKFRSRRTAAVVTNSRAVRRVLEESGVPGGKVHVVYNAKEAPDRSALARRLPELRDELDLGGPGPIIGAVGRARPEKGFQFLVEAAPVILAEHPQARFVLVGAGTERFVPRLEELGVQRAFRLPGHRLDAVAIMAALDLFVIPSVDMESCPNTLLEAMGVGLPAVGADTGGIAEIIVDGVTGRVVPAGDAQALAAAALAILGDRNRARCWGEAGRRRVAAEFSLDAKVRNTLRVYEEVLAR